MSLILDALRRADAERQRGGVPGLHAQTGITLPTHGGTGPQAASRQHWLLLGAVGALLLAGLAVLAWLRIGTPAPVPAAALPVAVPAAVLVATPAAAPVAATAASAPPQPGVLAATPAPAPPQPAGVPPRPAGMPPQPAGMPPQPAGVPPQPAAAPHGPAPSALLPRPVAAPALPRTPAAQQVAAAAAQRLPTLADLPEALRRELPAMTLGGSMYAEQPALRMVIINGQVVHEGDRLAPELLVQQIRPKSVVLNLRGQAFELGL